MRPGGFDKPSSAVSPSSPHHPAVRAHGRGGEPSRPRPPGTDHAYGSGPTQEEVAAAADIPLERVQQLDEASRLISLDRLVGDDEETAFGDLVEDADAPAPFEAISRRKGKRCCGGSSPSCPAARPRS